jgi:hypothetical protein
MKLPLIAACLVAGSAWSFANADVTASTNQKTAPRPYTPAQSANARGPELVKPDLRVQKNTRATKEAQSPHEVDNSLQKEIQNKLAMRAQAQAQALAAKQAAQQAAGGSSVGSGRRTAGSAPHSMVVAAPTNDDCSTPTVIVGAGTFAFDNTGATTGVDGQSETLCNIYGTTAIPNDIWFQWVAPSSGVASYVGCGLGSPIDTKVSVYAGAGCPVAGSSLGCDDDFCGYPNYESRVNFPVTAGSTYTIQVGNYPFGGTPGAGSFSMQVVAAAAGDSCGSPIVIGGTGSFPFDNSVASTGSEGQTESLCYIFGSTTVANDIWYQWTSPFTGTAQMDTCGAPVDTKIAAYAGAGCPVAGTALACDDDGCGYPNSKIQFSVTAGSTYMLQLGTYPFAAGGVGSFNLTQFIALPLDDCSLPAVISGVGSFPFDTTGMTTSTQQGFCGGNSGQDMWFQWTAPATGMCQLDTCGSSFDTLIKAYAGAGCPAGAALACDDDSNCGGFFVLQSTILFPVTAGNVYMLQIGGFAGSFGPGAFNLAVLLPPANDDCSTPTAVAGFGVFPFDNTVATTGVDGQAEALCNIYSTTSVPQDVWFTWTAPSSGQVSFDTCGLTGVDTKMAVYAGAGCPVAGTAIGCDDDACGPPFQSRILFNATAGASYTLQIGLYPYGALGGAGNFEVVSAAPPANDDCTTATTLVGIGSFPYDNTYGTTGVVGQAEPLCAPFGGPAIDNDVWYQWTAPSSGCTIIDTCGSTQDTKMAIYAGAGCPVAGTALDCNDDACNTQSKLRLNVTAGATYTIQLGNFPGQPGGTGFLNISQPGAAPGDDNCATPTIVVGQGTFPFDNSACTAGCEGQSEALCTFYGTTSIDTDEWFQWTAPASGVAVMSTCAGSIDTKIAAYLGAGCPTNGSSVACADDSCPGFASTIVWNATAGTTYMLQIGTWPFGATPGPGVFDLNILTPPGPCDPLDDNTTENLWSLGGNSDTVWLNRFGEIGTTTTINSIDIMYGSAMFPGFSMPNGTPTDILLYADGVSQDGDPSDATLLAQIPSVVSNVDLDTYVNVPLVTPVTVTGYFFAGGHEVCPGGVWVAPEDTNSIWLNRSWEFGDNTGGAANLANPGSSAFPPTLMGTGPLVGFAGTFCVRVNCSFGPATYTCTPGDPGIGTCPCGNPPTGANRGCNNKGATGGASITGSGVASVGAPTLTFTTANENATVGSVLIQGTAFNAGINFGHGVRCTAGTIKRLYVKIASAGSITAPGGGDPSIPVKSASLGSPIAAGNTRYYSVYYRDTTLLLPGCPVPANQFNVTNTAVVLWQP